MALVRPAALAGKFYPGEAETLKEMVSHFLNKSHSNEVIPPLNNLRAFIAPHAGYIYSGQTAAHAYHQLKQLKKTIKKILLLGPSHHVGFEGVAACTHDFYSTPLGKVAIDKEMLVKLFATKQIGILNEAHAFEHSLEVHVPFLQMTLDEFKLIPLIVGQADGETIASIIKTCWNNDTFVIISSDLSHYLTYDDANKQDAITTQQILSLSSKPLVGQQACGCRPINGLIEFARTNDLKPVIIDIKNSGDTAGQKNRVVGYGAYGFIQA